MPDRPRTVPPLTRTDLGDIARKAVLEGMADPFCPGCRATVAPNDFVKTLGRCLDCLAGRL